jgi:hypothetical protein
MCKSHHDNTSMNVLCCYKNNILRVMFATSPLQSAITIDISNMMFTTGLLQVLSRALLQVYIVFNGSCLLLPPN